MRDKPYKERQKGFSLMEVLIVIAIIGILTALAINSFRETGDKYRVESETKEMFANLMDARARALQRNRISFVRIETNGYETYEDTAPAPDGDGILTITPVLGGSGDKLVVKVTLPSHTIVTHGLVGGSSGYETFRFGPNGVASVTSTGFIRIVTPDSRIVPDYDCIVIGPTRVKMGQFSTANGGTCVEK